MRGASNPSETSGIRSVGVRDRIEEKCRGRGVPLGLEVEVEVEVSPGGDQVCVDFAKAVAGQHRRRATPRKGRGT